MKLSDIKGERAIEVIADLIEPVANIATDKECADLFSVKPVKGEDKNVSARKHLVRKVPLLLRTHKRDVIQIIATIDGKSVDDMNLFSITAALIGIVQDEELIELFTSAARSVEQTPPIDTCTKQDE